MAAKSNPRRRRGSGSKRRKSSKRRNTATRRAAPKRNPTRALQTRSVTNPRRRRGRKASRRRNPGIIKRVLNPRFSGASGAVKLAAFGLAGMLAVNYAANLSIVQGFVGRFGAYGSGGFKIGAAFAARPLYGKVLDKPNADAFQAGMIIAGLQEIATALVPQFAQRIVALVGGQVVTVPAATQSAKSVAAGNMQGLVDYNPSAIGGNMGGLVDTRQFA